ncbi:7198_t:CDS:2 [Acaulospora morrowiae]|uniref:7198_t:CDS:1 n=1 Tax=Acaulospora morrowiae TaxID=94023 RepID=A0A9N8W9H1_9GLOM|nr:7198_t:CDS:2 [Acaulospora morrowiae]
MSNARIWDKERHKHCVILTRHIGLVEKSERDAHLHGKYEAELMTVKKSFGMKVASIRPKLAVIIDISHWTTRSKNFRCTDIAFFRQ